MKIFGHFLGIVLAVTGAGPVYAAQPSFDCRKAITAVALTICADQDASAADWQLVSAYWAVYATKEGVDR